MEAPTTEELFIENVLRYPLLTVAEERQLTREKQLYALALLAEETGELPAPSEIDDLGRWREDMRRSKAAFDRLWCCNLRLVVKLANRWRHAGPEILDLYQEGSLGLQRAIVKFDPERGLKLSTYATPWIQQALGRCTNKWSIGPRLPEHVAVPMRRYRKAVYELAIKLGREPTDDELCRELEMEPAELEKLQLLDRPTVPLNKIAATAEGDGIEIGEYLLAAEPDLQPEAQAIANDTPKAVRRALAELPDKQREAVCLYYGIDCEPRTLEEVGAKLGISGAGVRLRIEKALTIMRENPALADLL